MPEVSEPSVMNGNIRRSGIYSGVRKKAILVDDPVASFRFVEVIRNWRQGRIPDGKE